MEKVPVTLKKGFVFPGFAGWVPLPGLIIYNPKYGLGRHFIAHELMHVTQWNRYGVWFLFLYVFQWVSVGFSYWNIPLEVEAREAESNHEYLLWADEILRKHKII
jgi:fatty acid desaturase